MFWLASAIESQVLVLGFGSGLLFFITGLTVTLLARHYRQSRFPIAATFPSLGLFGMAYGAARWGGIFIPVQSPDLAPTVVAALHWVEVGLDLVAAAALVVMAARLHAPDVVSDTANPNGTEGLVSDAAPRPAMGVLLSLLVVGAAAHAIATDVGLLIGLALGLRWTVAVPAALWLALGLWRQPAARGVHRRLAVSLMVLALAFLVEGAGRFPGHTSLIRGAAGVLLLWPMLRLLGLLDLEYRQRLEAALRAQSRLEERHALGQALQDGVLQQCYATGLRLEAADALLDRNPGRARLELRAAMRTLTGAVEGIRAYLEEGAVVSREPAETPGDAETG